MKALVFFLLLAVLIGVAYADSTTIIYPFGSAGSQNLAVYKISLTADINGTIDYTTIPVYGKLYAVSWLNGTTTAINGTIYLNTTLPYVASLENYNLSLGNATEFTRTSTLMHFLSGPMTLECSDGTANQTCEAWLYIEQ